MKYAWLIFRNLSRDLRRTVLTLLAIAVAAIITTALFSLPYVMRQVLSSPVGARRLVTMNKAGFFFSLPEAYRLKLEAIPHVDAVSSLVFFGGAYRDPSEQIGVAVDADAIETLWPDWGISPNLSEVFERMRISCLVPPAMMRKYHWRIGNEIMLKGSIYPVNLTLHIEGVLGERAPPDALMFRRDYLDEVLHGRTRVNAFYVLIDNRALVPSVMGAIDETFANSSAQTTTASEEQWARSFFNLDTLLTMLTVIAWIVVAAMALVAANTMVMSVRERRKQFAIMQAVGFGPRLLKSLILAESTAIGMFGGMLGCAVAFFLARIVNVSVLPLGPIDLFAIVPGGVIVVALVLSALIGFTAGAIASVGIARPRVVDTLRVAS